MLASAQQDSPEETARARLSRLQGKAYVDRHTDVIGATVVVQPLKDPSRLFLTSTGDDGVFHVEGLADGDYRVRLEREGFVPLVKERVNLRFPFRAVVEVRMSEGAAAGLPQAQPAVGGSGSTDPLLVRGRVLEQGKGPLGEIYLRFIRPDGRRDPRYLRSAEDGAFRAEEMLPGRWRVHVQGVGYLPVVTEVDLDRDTDLLVYLVRQPADYEPSPRELMLPEQPLPPKGLRPMSVDPG
jgi:hypothetical protein